MKAAIFVVLGCLLPALPLAACAQSATKGYSQTTLLKNWALARCLGKVYEDKQVEQDAYATASAYLEFGKQPMAAYEAVGRLVDKYAARTLGGSVSSDYETMKCIDLFHSDELDELVKRWVDKTDGRP